MRGNTVVRSLQLSRCGVRVRVRTVKAGVNAARAD